MKLKLFSLLVLLLVLFSCETEEDILDPEVKLTSVKIVQNEKDGIVLEVAASGSWEDVGLTDHGLVWLQNNKRVSKLQLGPLKENPFTATIRSGMRKGGVYDVFPYVMLNSREVRGDTVTLVSEIEREPKLLDIMPRTGFIGDTISIIGEDFYVSPPNYVYNYLLLGEGSHAGISDSEELIKAVITPQLSKSEAGLGLRTCDTLLTLEGNFVIDPPQLDSISPKLVYAGEELVLYGENIHSDVSQLWLGGVEVPLMAGHSVDTLVATIPNALSPGLLDLKLQVIDRFVEKPAYYTSTTPVLEEINPMPTGFLDTITISGKYLYQHSEKLEVLIGEQPQRILEVGEDFLQVVINHIFGQDEPFLVLNTGEFSLRRPVSMLPPEILSVDKEIYHLDDELNVNTRYYLGNGSQTTVGGSSNYGGFSGPGITEVDENGTFSLDLYHWLELRSPHLTSFTFDKPGELTLHIETAYGKTERNIKIAAPAITGLSADSYSLGTPLEFTGTDFGHKGVSKIYVDGKLVEDPNNSSYSVTNYTAGFSVPTHLQPGTHSLKIFTGGQESNTVQFEVRDLTVDGLSATTGTRRETFTIGGGNLSNRTVYSILANGKSCPIISSSESEVVFKLPPDNELKPVVKITLEYGPKTIDVGQIATTEPHERIQGYQVSPNYILDRPTFTYNDAFHFINRTGIYRLDLEDLTWSLVQPQVPQAVANSFESSRKEVPVVGSRIYFAGSGNMLHHYDFNSGTWGAETLKLEEGSYMQRIAIEGDSLMILLSTKNGYEFVRYDLNSHNLIATSQPGINIGMIYNLNFHQYGQKLFIDKVDGDIMMYDMKQDAWENIGFPKPYSYFYHNVLFGFEGKLYLSGGQGNIGAERGLYSYDLATEKWTEQVPTLDVLTEHAVFASEGSLYFLLGRTLYQHQNSILSKYVIDEDPY